MLHHSEDTFYFHNKLKKLTIIAAFHPWCRRVAEGFPNKTGHGQKKASTVTGQTQKQVKNHKETSSKRHLREENWPESDLGRLKSTLRSVHTIRFQGSDSWSPKLYADFQSVRFQASVFVGAFHLSRRVSDDNWVLFPSGFFSKLWIHVSDGHFPVCT